MALAVHTGVEDNCLCRGDFQQAADGVAGALDGVAFQGLAQGKEDHHQPGFAVGADEDRADGGNCHQPVDGDLAVDAQRAPAGAGDWVASQQHRQQGGNVKEPVFNTQHRQEFVEE